MAARLRVCASKGHFRLSLASKANFGVQTTSCKNVQFLELFGFQIKDCELVLLLKQHYLYSLIINSVVVRTLAPLQCGVCRDDAATHAVTKGLVVTS